MAVGIDQMIKDLVHLISMKNKIKDRIEKQRSDIRLYYELQGYSEKDIDNIMSDYEER